MRLTRGSIVPSTPGVTGSPEAGSHSVLTVRASRFGRCDFKVNSVNCVLKLSLPVPITPQYGGLS